MRLRKQGAIPPLPQYDFMACTYLSKKYIFREWYLVKNEDMFTFYLM
jgi:hypothetical protein